MSYLSGYYPQILRDCVNKNTNTKKEYYISEKEFRNICKQLNGCDYENNNTSKNIQLKIEKLSSNIEELARNQDRDLVNSWGIVIIENTIWVANNGSNTVTSYDLKGNKLQTIVRINLPTGAPGSPTGIVHNTSSSFIVSSPFLSGPSFAPALWLAATEQGTIEAYNPTISASNTITVIDRTGSGVFYTGLAIVGTFLYAVDFHNKFINVFDGTFGQIFSFPFFDPSSTIPPTPDAIPEDFSPFNIVNIDGLLYVTYAKIFPNSNDDIPGEGNGFINVFNPLGVFVRRFASRGPLNSPWAIIKYSSKSCVGNNLLLVGNSGDGTIIIYNQSGKFSGRINNCNNSTLFIDGLWGLAKSCNGTYFTAGPNNGNDGLLGRLLDGCKRIK